MNAKIRTRSLRQSNATDQTLRRLVAAPETANQIFEFAESLYWRDETSERMALGDIEQVNQFLRQTENDLNRMKKQFQDLAEIDDGFQSNIIPIGF